MNSPSSFGPSLHFSVSALSSKSKPLKVRSLISAAASLVFAISIPFFEKSTMPYGSCSDEVVVVTFRSGSVSKTIASFSVV